MERRWFCEGIIKSINSNIIKLEEPYNTETHNHG
jgi:hypothetical protein